jgi:hypothetical protein
MSNTGLILSNSTRCPHRLVQTKSGVDAYVLFGLVLDSEIKHGKVLDSLYEKQASFKKITVY